MLKSISGLSKQKDFFLFNCYEMMLSDYFEVPKMKHFSETHHCSYRTLSCDLYIVSFVKAHLVSI